MIAFLRRLLLEDFGLKLFSLVLAVALYLIVSLAIEREVSPATALTSASEKQTFFNLPVVVMSSAADVRAFKVSPDTVAVTLRGDPKILQQLQPQDIRVLVDLTDIEAARFLRKRLEVVPRPGVTLVRVQPEEVQVIYPSRS
jgi:YbbR domain-containing protein